MDSESSVSAKQLQCIFMYQSSNQTLFWCDKDFCFLSLYPGSHSMQRKTIQHAGSSHISEHNFVQVPFCLCCFQHQNRYFPRSPQFLRSMSSKIWFWYVSLWWVGKNQVQKGRCRDSQSWRFVKIQVLCSCSFGVRFPALKQGHLDVCLFDVRVLRLEEESWWNERPHSMLEDFHAVLMRRFW